MCMFVHISSPMQHGSWSITTRSKAYWHYRYQQNDRCNMTSLTARCSWWAAISSISISYHVFNTGSNCFQFISALICWPRFINNRGLYSYSLAYGIGSYYTYQAIIGTYRGICGGVSRELALKLLIWVILPIQNDAKKQLRNDWNPGILVLIWKYSARAIQWIPTWQGLDVFQKSLRLCPRQLLVHIEGSPFVLWAETRQLVIVRLGPLWGSVISQVNGSLFVNTSIHSILLSSKISTNSTQKNTHNNCPIEVQAVVIYHYSWWWWRWVWWLF